MELPLLRMFQQQVLLQCKFALLGAHDVEKGLAEGHNTRVFYGLQNLLTAAANISKVLWGSGGKLADERAPIRASINVDDSSPLASTDMRNNHDHFDSRIDDWWRDTKTQSVVDLNIGPAGMIEGVATTDRFRHFDPQTGQLFFFAKSYDSAAIVAEIGRILPLVRIEAEKPT